LANHLSKLPRGKSIFLDANIFHFYLRGPVEIQKGCTSLLQRVERREIHGVTSSLVLDEVMYKILLKTIEDKHRMNPLDVIRKSFEQIGVQSKEIHKALDIILGIEGLEVLAVDRHHIETSVDYMEKFSLLPRDSIHLSIMKSIHCSDIATGDSDFDRVFDIGRWTPLATGE
jgi:predicted nucleic acid-binding protein